MLWYLFYFVKITRDVPIPHIFYALYIMCNFTIDTEPTINDDHATNIITIGLVWM